MSPSTTDKEDDDTSSAATETQPVLNTGMRGDDQNHHDDADSSIPRNTKLYCLCASLNSVNFGYDLGCSTSAAVKIQHSFKLSNTQLEVFVGTLNFFTIFGALLSPLISDKYGRRTTFFLAAVGFIVGCLLQATSQSYIILMVGRTLLGMGVGVGLTVDPLYIGEISPPQHRGYLVSWSEIGIDMGVILGFASSFVVYPVNSEDLQWRIMVGLGIVMPSVMIYLCLYIMPESPRWLLQQNQEAAARTVLQECNNKDANVDVIIQEIEESIQVEGIGGWRTLLYRPSPAIRRMLLVGVGVATMQQIVGIDAIMFYLLYMIQRSGVDSELGQAASLIALGFVKMGFVFVGSRLLDSEGRRPLFLKSLFGCAGSLLFVSFAISSDSNLSKFLTVFGLASYLAFFSLSIGPGAWVVVTEVFSTSIRAKAVSIALFPNRVVATLMASTFLTIASVITWQGFFVLLAVICLLCAVFVYHIVPETANKSLEEMSHYFAELTNDRSFLEHEYQARRGATTNRHDGGERRDLEITYLSVDQDG